MKIKITSLFILSLLLLASCSDDGNSFPKVVPYPEVDKPAEPEKPATVEKYTIFNSGEDNINSYRIPSIVTTKNGTLLAFSEARRDSWTDRSYTNIVVKRSIDNGKTWSRMQYLTDVPVGADIDPGAYINPCPVVDMETGKIFLFTVFWEKRGDNLGDRNTAFLITSEDDGVNWSTPKNISSELLVKDPYPGTTNTYQFIFGFGPGSGFQMQGDKYKGRLIVPCSQSYILGKNVKKSNVTVYSDDHGKTWKPGKISKWYAEYQIAESPNNTLINNLRASVSGVTQRGYTRSFDGGVDWNDFSVAMKYYPLDVLQTPAGGCQASILGKDNVLYYSGPAGIAATTSNDDRALMMLYKSIDGGDTWDKGQLLYDKAAGYSCLTFLKDGRLGVLFEAGPKLGFEKSTQRPAGWMRLDLMIVPQL